MGDSLKGLTMYAKSLGHSKYLIVIFNSDIIVILLSPNYTSPSTAVFSPVCTLSWQKCQVQGIADHMATVLGNIYKALVNQSNLKAKCILGGLFPLMSGLFKS